MQVMMTTSMIITPVLALLRLWFMCRHSLTGLHQLRHWPLQPRSHARPRRLLRTLARPLPHSHVRPRHRLRAPRHVRLRPPLGHACLRLDSVLHRHRASHPRAPRLHTPVRWHTRMHLVPRCLALRRAPVLHLARVRHRPPTAA